MVRTRVREVVTLAKNKSNTWKEDAGHGHSPRTGHIAIVFDSLSGLSSPLWFSNRNYLARKPLSCRGGPRPRTGPLAIELDLGNQLT